MSENTPTSAETSPAVAGQVERPVRPRAWWRLSVYAQCDPCVTVNPDEADFWRSEGLTVVELGDVAAERERCGAAMTELAALWPELRQLVDGLAGGSYWTDWDASVQRRMVEFSLRHMAVQRGPNVLVSGPKRVRST